MNKKIKTEIPFMPDRPDLRQNKDLLSNYHGNKFKNCIKVFKNSYFRLKGHLFETRNALSLLYNRIVAYSKPKVSTRRCLELYKFSEKVNFMF